MSLLMSPQLAHWPPGCFLYGRRSKWAVMRDGPQIVSVKQLAELLQISTDTVYRWVNAGTVPSLRTTPRGRLRFVVDDVLDALRTHNDQHPADHLPRRPGRPRLRVPA